MESILITLCIILIIIVIVLIAKIVLLRKSAMQLSKEFKEKLNEDTNVGIYITTNDKRMNELAASINHELRNLRKMQLRYTQGDNELKSAVTNISHDLRTPLTAICGYMELLRRENMSDTADEYISIIDNRIENLKALTDELFRYSIIMSVDSYSDREYISLNSAIEDCIAANFGAFTLASIEPEIHMPESQIRRNLNKNAISRILSNIVSNAIKYSNGDFYVSLDEDGTMLFRNSSNNLDVISVGHLFDRFYTVNSGHNSTGLGLSIAKTLTEDMGGKIEASYKGGMLTIAVRFG